MKKITDLEKLKEHLNYILVLCSLNENENNAQQQYNSDLKLKVAIPTRINACLKILRKLARSEKNN